MHMSLPASGSGAVVARSDSKKLIVGRSSAMSASYDKLTEQDPKVWVAIGRCEKLLVDAANFS
jgi:hypothetical protein